MKKIFISDLHLDEQQPAMTQLFLKFLNTQQQDVEELYILGDFFEIWLGDDDLSCFNQLIMDALQAVTRRGIKVYLMHGNRDFLIGKKFLRYTGCKLLPDEHVIDLYGTPTLLLHGDTLCTKDIAYMKFRKKARNWLLQKLFLLKSLEKRRAVAKKYRAASKMHTSTASEHIMDVCTTEVEQVMSKHKVQHLIHGHTHRPFVHHFTLQSQPATRTVLGAWHEHGSALVCDVNGRKELIVLE
jgi:UDP-2,3-diacylglucosamine hydrolase